MTLLNYYRKFLTYLRSGGQVVLSALTFTVWLIPKCLANELTLYYISRFVQNHTLLNLHQLDPQVDASWSRSHKF